MEEKAIRPRLRNTWVEIDLDSIVLNLNEARRIIPEKTKIAAVLKAMHTATEQFRLQEY